MSTFARRTILWATAAIGLFVGIWAAFAPVSFYDSFPGLGRIWVAVDGPFNEHLIRDVGSLYLALAAASIAAALSRGVAAGRAVGVAWIVFSVPHLGYHLQHLHVLTALDAALEVLALCSTIILGIPLVLPSRRPHRAPGADIVGEKEDSR